MSKKILIADDEQKIRSLMRTILELGFDGFDIHEAADGEEALSMAKEILPDLILLDIMMPGMTGYDVCKNLRKFDGTKDTPILIVTARGSEITDRTMEIVGADGFLPKPFTPLELEHSVKKALQI